ncbi:hypothetical protein FQT01_00930 [Enterococcus faecalis]|uniref:hypothetical protein n=1 Tax=Enterococcus faecalis TaxID=1351 RepID=UPI0003757062|nr:hypothetical protein [Enterococcus faecalis]EPI33369.1 hypothetical protein D350_00274 [Enterococcus faecalis VC1B-1]MBO1103878.1 hypothetical protein [Enterococcus faecalis]NSU49497.1 hypothetical protein [Enterococcus faecalis]RBR98043.1 hypothetical protein EA79_02767 [Enterococcus faecalis]
MKITQTELSNRRKLAKAIMAAKKEDHDTWLGELYQQYISTNQDTLTEALAMMTKQTQAEKTPGSFYSNHKNNGGGQA